MKNIMVLTALAFLATGAYATPAYAACKCAKSEVCKCADHKECKCKKKCKCDKMKKKDGKPCMKKMKSESHKSHSNYND